MKIWFITALFLSSNVFAQAQKPIALPVSLLCQEVYAIIWRSSEEALRSVEIKNLDTKPNSTDTYQSSQGSVDQPADSDKVFVNFSDGDQLEVFTFKKEELADLSAGKLKSIRGLRDIGFSWADGDHTDRLTVVECR